ncbi:hypothetical protein ACIBCM_06390 [Streptomyces sp. NPDC051018]|uniref:hypothetical protein n=1 Tax=Streptomyces sp. NPDC051018 TaxID=3365639 RepID=UPI003794103A
MTATPDRLALPARRRRHARLIAALTTLIGACAEAAGAVYQPVADAPPGQEAVTADLMPCIQVSLAATLLDRAHDEDNARWPAAVERERVEARRTDAARCAVARAQELAENAGPPGLPLPTVEQAAVMDLASAGDAVAARWRRDPQQAVVLVHELAASGEFLVDEVLDAAVDAAVLTGLVVLQEARASSVVRR